MRDDVEPRSSPLLSQLVLWVAFALLVVASVITVLLPEIGDEGEVDESAEPRGETPDPTARH